MIKKITVLCIDHKCGTNMLAFESAAAFQQWKEDQARTHWSEWFEDEPVPEDVDDLVEQYYEAISNLGLGSCEYWTWDEFDIMVPEVAELLNAAEILYNDAADRGETMDDFGDEHHDWKALRLAIEKTKRPSYETHKR